MRRRPSNPAYAADLLGDLPGSDPDFEITEHMDAEPIAGSPLDPNGFTNNPGVIIGDGSDESTVRIDWVPSIPPPATTLVDPSYRDGPPRPHPSGETPPDANATGIVGIPAGLRPLRSHSPTPSKPIPVAPKLSLPCNVVVIDDDRRAGAQTGARLMEVGCSCRAVTLEESDGILDHSVHAVLLEVPATEARTDGGRERIERISPWKGPLVLTSAAAIDPLPEVAGAAVTKPYFIEDLIAAIETARRKPPVRNPSRIQILDPVEAVAHHDLDANVVRAMMVRSDGQVGRGRVRTMSYDGELLVAMNGPPKQGADVAVELTISDGRRMEITGKIKEADGNEMEIALRLGENERAFVRQFLDQARDITQPFIEQVRIKQLQGNAAAADEGQLAKLWQEALAKIEDDAVQQRFIQACLKAQNLEHAVKCYRQLKQERPGDERVAKYLQQVGTILGFYALAKQPDVKGVDAKLPMPVKIAMGLFLAAALILWIMMVVMR